MLELKSLKYLLWAVAGVSVALLLLNQAWIGAVVVALVGAVAHWQAVRVIGAHEEVFDAVEQLAAGDLSQSRLTIDASGSVGEMATAVNRLLTQLRLISEEAIDLAQGTIGVQHLQDEVVDSGQLSVVDIPTSDEQGDLNRSFAELTNQLRRVTVKAHIIANDQLFNPALDEELPGELGDAFAMMVKNLRGLATRAEDIAGGDLSTQVAGEGDLTDVFNDMIVGLRQLVDEITESALQVATSTEEMHQVLRRHEESAVVQVERIDETRQTVANLFQSSDEIADGARQVHGDAEETCEKSRQIVRRIEGLLEHSDRISEILDLIKNIANRSDLLALNASLEGVRAGNSGKGFALVAGEMRRLAENTKHSVADIEELVRDIQESARETANSCQQGVALSEQTTETAMSIRVVTGDQREDTGQVNEAMEELSSLVTQGATGVHQVRLTASELAELSGRLRQLVDRFKLGDSTYDTSRPIRSETSSTLESIEDGSSLNLS